MRNLCVSILLERSTKPTFHSTLFLTTTGNSPEKVVDYRIKRGHNVEVVNV